MSDYPQFLAPLIPCNLPVRRCPVPRQDAERRIVIMRTGAFGDILMGTPLLAALREAYPTAHLTWLVEPKYQECVDANPYIDEVITFNGGYWKRLLRAANVIGWGILALKFRSQLRRRHYDVFISLQPEEYKSLLSGVGAPDTIGIFDTFRRFSRAAETSPYVGRYKYAYTYDDLPPHRTDQYLLSLRALGLPGNVDRHMQLGYTAEDAAAIDRLLGENDIQPDASVIVLAPTTTWETRNWLPDRYAEVGNALARQGHKIVLVGNRRHKKHDKAALDTVMDIGSRLTPAPVIAMDSLTFRQLAALIDRAALVVGGDTGPAHMAGALDTPYVAVFGPTSPQWYAPLAGRGVALSHPVPCGPCDQKVCRNEAQDHRCMRLITVPEVLTTAERMLSETAAPT